MSDQAHRAYRKADLTTASPQRLRLMLIDAAIGYVTHARTHAQASHWAVAGEAFVQARRAVIELRAGIRAVPASEHGPAIAELAENVRALYAFLFRLLTESQLYRDPVRLDDALRLLTMERETWRQVCERAADSVAPRADANVGDPNEGEAFPSFSLRV